VPEELVARPLATRRASFNPAAKQQPPRNRDARGTQGCQQHPLGRGCAAQFVHVPLEFSLLQIVLSVQTLYALYNSRPSEPARRGTQTVLSSLRNREAPARQGLYHSNSWFEGFAEPPVGANQRIAGELETGSTRRPKPKNLAVLRYVSCS
jgi:hypothetical protein